MYNPFDEESKVPGSQALEQGSAWFKAQFGESLRLLLAHRWIVGVPIGFCIVKAVMALPVLFIESNWAYFHYPNATVSPIWTGDVFPQFIGKWLSSAVRITFSEMSEGVLKIFIKHFTPSLLLVFFAGPIFQWISNVEGVQESQAFKCLRMAWRIAQMILILLGLVAVWGAFNFTIGQAYISGARDAFQAAAVIIQTFGAALYLTAIGLAVRGQPVHRKELVNSAVQSYLALLPVMILLFLLSGPIQDTVTHIGIRIRESVSLYTVSWLLSYGFPLLMLPLVLTTAAMTAKLEDPLGGISFAVEKIKNRGNEAIALLLTSFLLVFGMTLVTTLRNYLFVGWTHGPAGWSATFFAGALHLSLLSWIFTTWVAWCAEGSPMMATFEPASVPQVEEILLPNGVPAKELVCPSCGAAAEPDSHFCDQCGELLVPIRSPHD